MIEQKLVNMISEHEYCPRSLTLTLYAALQIRNVSCCFEVVRTAPRASGGLELSSVKVVPFNLHFALHTHRKRCLELKH